MITQDIEPTSASLKSKSTERDWLMEARYADQYYLVTFLGKVYRVFLKDMKGGNEVINLVSSE